MRNVSIFLFAKIFTNECLSVMLLAGGRRKNRKISMCRQDDIGSTVLSPMLTKPVQKIIGGVVDTGEQ